jgi:lycopene cyclase domain-containing protein
MTYAYALLLLLSLACMAYGDYKRSLVIFKSTKTALKIIVAGVGFFLIWDVFGILLGVFATNQSYVLGIGIFSPNVPIEEVLFLTLLCYVTLLTWRLICLRTR